jgi:hypothetical protein
MFPILSALLAFIAGLFRSRASLCLEHLALRHQLAVYRQTVYHLRLRRTDRVFWGWLSRLWRGWPDALVFVQPRTVGIEVTESTVEKCRMRLSKPPSPTWKTCLTNHVQDLTALYFFGVPTVSCTEKGWMSGDFRAKMLTDHAEIFTSREQAYRVTPQLPFRRPITGWLSVLAPQPRGWPPTSWSDPWLVGLEKCV